MPHTQPPAAHRWTRATPLLLALLAGCSAPLFEDAPPIAEVDASRLRSVERRSLSEYLKPAPVQPQPLTIDDQLAQAKARFESAESIQLSLEDARVSALRHNLDLQVALVDPTLARERVSEEEARFESAFTLSTRWIDYNQPTSSTLSSSQNQNLSIEPGVRIPLRTGGTINVNVPWSQNDNNNSFSTLNPSYSNDFDFSISQPLLRGAGRRANTASIRIARYNEQASLARTKLEVTRQLAAVDRSYWLLYGTRKQLEVRQQQYELAVAQLQSAERKVRAGSAAEIETIRAQAGVADRLEGIILAQNDVRTRQRELKTIINRPGLTVETDTAVLTATPPDPAEYAFNKPELVASALANRMELLDLELQLAADAANIAFEKNQSLPLATLDYVYRLNGLGASSQDAHKMVRDADFQDWELGLSVEVPLGNERAKSRVRQAILTRLARLSTKDARQLSIKQEVLQAVDQLDATWQRIMAARQSVVLNTRAFQGEQRQFDVGKSTSTNVLDAATRLADAQTAEINAVVDYQIAQVDLAFATGTLLGQGKIDFEPLPPPRASEHDPKEELGGEK